MKYYIIIVLLWVGVIQVFAQQPRLKQVNEYLVATGRPIELKVCLKTIQFVEYSI